MNLETLEQQTADSIRPAVVQTSQILSGFEGMKMPPSLWMRILVVLFGFVSPAAEGAAMVARAFYDAQRAKAFPGIPRNDLFLSTLSFEKFVQDMEDVRPLFVGTEVTASAVHRAALQAARSAANSGRWTIMHATEAPDPWLDGDFEWDEDSTLTVSTMTPEERKEFREQNRAGRKGLVRGWARVATGKETCGWCLMLVSRGPVYRSAQSAGSLLENREAMSMTRGKDFDPDEQMRQWHAGCDCMVVPVFKLENFEGYDRWKAAERMWIKETKGLSGKDAVNAFRRAAESGKYLDYMKN